MLVLGTKSYLTAPYPWRYKRSKHDWFS